MKQDTLEGKPINKYRPTPIIGKIRIKMTQGIFIEEVLSDAYNPKTKIPLKILVNKFIISARAIIEADNEMQRIKDKIGMFHEI